MKQMVYEIIFSNLFTWDYCFWMIESSRSPSGAQRHTLPEHRSKSASDYYTKQRGRVWDSLIPPSSQLFFPFWLLMCTSYNILRQNKNDLFSFQITTYFSSGFSVWIDSHWYVYLCNTNILDQMCICWKILIELTSTWHLLKFSFRNNGESCRLKLFLTYSLQSNVA